MFSVTRLKYSDWISLFVPAKIEKASLFHEDNSERKKISWKDRWRSIWQTAQSIREVFPRLGESG